MAIKVTFQDGSTQIIPRAVRVNAQNYHEGMYDFYSKEGGLMEQISLDHNIRWEIIDEPEEQEKERVFKP